MNNQSEIDKLAQIIWDYSAIRQEVEKADLIFILCSYDVRVAEYAAELFLSGYAPLILFSGGIAHEDDILKTPWNIPEAEKFAEIAIEKGVPGEKIMIENRATNTGENFLYSYDLLKQKNIQYRKIILVQKPFMLRRVYATFMKQWPGEKIDIILTAPPIDFLDYPNEILPKDVIINTMMGDLQRIKLYPEKGFQVYQEIPDNVWDAFEKLCALGYTKHLLK